jgi:hypothetical protein
MDVIGEEVEEDISHERVVRLMDAFKSEFEQVVADYGISSTRTLEALNALALEAAAIILSFKKPENREQLATWFYRAFSESLIEGGRGELPRN